jgi:phosphonate transport system substrate-binding protein
MRMHRRSLIASAMAAALPLRHASAAGWQAQFPELVFSVVPAENASGVMDRYAPFVAYLSRELGTKVVLRIANDYAAVIEGQRAGHVQIASYGPAAFARARLTGVQTDAVLIRVNADGTTGYFSVFYVLASSPYKDVNDVRGRNIGFVDPNSTSGNQMPRFWLNKRGITPENFFGKVVYTGSHENAVIALAQGQVDICANSWTSAEDSTLVRMLTKNMLRFPNGTPMKYGDFRIIATSDLIINGPVALLSSLPAELKASVKAAFLDAPVKDKAAYDRLSDGKKEPWIDTNNAAYDETVALIRFVDSLRKA